MHRREPHPAAVDLGVSIAERLQGQIGGFGQPPLDLQRDLRGDGAGRARHRRLRLEGAGVEKPLAEQKDRVGADVKVAHRSANGVGQGIAEDALSQIIGVRFYDNLPLADSFKESGYSVLG